MEENSIQQEITQTQSPIILPKQSQRKTNNKLFFILLCVVLLIFLSGGIYVVIVKNASRLPENKQPSFLHAANYQIVTETPQISPPPGQTSEYESINTWKDYISNSHLITFKYPQKCTVYADTSILIHVGCPTINFMLRFEKENQQFTNPIQTEKMLLKNGKDINFTYYHDLSQPPESKIVILKGTYTENGEVLYFTISPSPLPYQKDALAMMKQLLSTFTFISQKDIVNADGLETYSGVSAVGRKPFSFQYPSHYILAYDSRTDGVSYVLTDQNNNSNTIQLKLDNINNPTSYNDYLTSIQKSSPTIKIENLKKGVLVSGIPTSCYGVPKCPDTSEILLPYAQTTAVITFSPAIQTKDLFIITNSFQEIN